MSVHEGSGDRSASAPSPQQGRESTGIDPAITALALLYAHGELEGPAAAAFEARLGADQSVRDALCQAVQLTQSLGGMVAPAPDPCYRDRVREHLLPTPGMRRREASLGRWWSGLVRPRLYRGHPAIWAVAGAMAAALLVGVWMPRPSPATVEELPLALVGPAPMPEVTPIPQPKPEPETTTTMAQVWAELNTDDHLNRVWAEEQKRRHRHEERRLVRSEERAGGGVSH